MLTIEPAARRQAGRAKLAIALAGGGPLGFFYQLGALHALSEAIEGRRLTEFDVYVGVSSGSLIAAALASGFDTAAMCAMFLYDESILFPFSPAILLRPAFREYARRLSRLPNVLAQIAQRCLRDPGGGVWEAGIGPLGRLLPTALFDSEPLQDYLRLLFNSEGHTDDFRKLRARLYVVATNLNTGASESFGGLGHQDVPISRALLASSALPGLYPAVEIDGEQYVDGALIRTMHASLALEEKCNFVICINPIVPFDASHPRARRPINLLDEGLPAILGQTFRALVYSRMKVGMATYAARFPAADTLLLEPDRHDERLFFANVFRYAERLSLADHAYRRTRRDLLAQADVIAPLLERRDLRLNIKVLRDPNRSLPAANKSSRRVRQTARRLDFALGRIERMLRAPGLPG
ncbi:MAG TPA: patatin-like phospholipase family protein [Steroidobacteraceae bacterium]|nr:patatin-like phospholipase family protein [Steroidobacteraceae bacterium]